MTVMLFAVLSFYLKKTFKMHFIFNYVYMRAEAGVGCVHVSAGALGPRRGHQIPWSWSHSWVLLPGTKVREVGAYCLLLGVKNHNDNNNNNNIKLGFLCYSFSHPKTPQCHPFPGNYSCPQGFFSTLLLPCWIGPTSSKAQQHYIQIFTHIVVTNTAP